MSEYKAYWLTGFPLIKLLGARHEIIMVIFKKETNKYKEKIVILQSIGIIQIKTKKTMVVTYATDILVGI